MQLQLEIIDTPTTPVNIPHTDADLQKLEKRVFTFDTSESDKRYFRQQLYLYMQSDEYKPFHQFLWNMIWTRNEEGKYCKYLYFNERIQHLFIDRDFLSWAKKTTDIIGNFLNIF